MDGSFQSTPGASPAATLKDQFRKRYSKYELNQDSKNLCPSKLDLRLYGLQQVTN
jgi:hypothetical protein